MTDKETLNSAIQLLEIMAEEPYSTTAEDIRSLLRKLHLVLSRPTVTNSRALMAVKEIRQSLACRGGLGSFDEDNLQIINQAIQSREVMDAFIIPIEEINKAGNIRTKAEFKRILKGGGFWLSIGNANKVVLTEDHLSKEDYFTDLVARAREAAQKAHKKFPQPNYITLKIAEEAGEVVRGCVHYAEGRLEWSDVENEIVQLIAMLIRLVTEGDQVNGVRPPHLSENYTISKGA